MLVIKDFFMNVMKHLLLDLEHQGVPKTRRKKNHNECQ